VDTALLLDRVETGVEEVEVDIGLAHPEELADAARLAANAWDVPPRGDELERSLRDEHSIVVCARRDGHLVGVTTATIVDGRVASSDETVVDPEVRSHRVGRRLLVRMIEILRARGVREVRGQSSSKRRDGLAFVMRLGFHVVGAQIADHLPGFADGTIVLRTRLAL
jgi:GNAT superfamily N-acetyltransferase